MPIAANSSGRNDNGATSRHLWVPHHDNTPSGDHLNPGTQHLFGGHSAGEFSTVLVRGGFPFYEVSRRRMRQPVKLDSQKSVWELLDTAVRLQEREGTAYNTAWPFPHCQVCIFLQHLHVHAPPPLPPPTLCLSPAGSPAAARSVSSSSGFACARIILCRYFCRSARFTQDRTLHGRPGADVDTCSYRLAAVHSHILLFEDILCPACTHACRTVAQMCARSSGRRGAWRCSTSSSARFFPQPRRA